MRFLVGLVAIALSCCSHSCWAGNFTFGSDANGLAGLADATIIEQGGFALNLQAGPTGAVFNESDSDGLGINTRGIADVDDGGGGGDPDKFNIIDGTAAVSGQGEFVVFSFEQAGVVESLLFDGLKDETLEYFSIEFPNAMVVTVFDSQVEQRLTDQGFQLSDLGVPNPTLAPNEEDDFEVVEYAFEAGQEFKLTYGEVDFTNVLPGYVPVAGGVGNGARFQGIVVRAIPEPSTAVLALAATLLAAVAHRRQ